MKNTINSFSRATTTYKLDCLRPPRLRTNRLPFKVHVPHPNSRLLVDFFPVCHFFSPRASCARTSPLRRPPGLQSRPTVLHLMTRSPTHLYLTPPLQRRLHSHCILRPQRKPPPTESPSRLIYSIPRRLRPRKDQMPLFYHLPRSSRQRTLH